MKTVSFLDETEFDNAIEWKRSRIKYRVDCECFKLTTRFTGPVISLQASKDRHILYNLVISLRRFAVFCAIKLYLQAGKHVNRGVKARRNT